MKERKDYVMYYDLYENLPVHDDLDLKDYVLGPKELSEKEYNQLEKLADQEHKIYETWMSTNKNVVEDNWTPDNKNRFKNFTGECFLPVMNEIKSIMEEIIEIDTDQYMDDYDKLTNKFRD